MVVLVMQKAVFSLTVTGSAAENLMRDLHVYRANKTCRIWFTERCPALGAQKADGCHSADLFDL